MHCPFCGYVDHKVLDSRPAKEGQAIRRRRECIACGRRFTTFEEFEKPRLFVVKRGGSREEFSKEKVFESMRIACRKRPVSVEALKASADRVERDLFQEFEEEIPAKSIGERVMRELRMLDEVAYVRFASVYRKFDTADDFAEFVDSVKGMMPAEFRVTRVEPVSETLGETPKGPTGETPVVLAEKAKV